MKRKGTSIIFSNRLGEVLLVLRDDKPEILYPNMWDLPGGHVEEGETPRECIIREMVEETELDVRSCRQHSVYDFSDRVEYIFLIELNLEPEQITLHEGQMLRWFAEQALPKLPIAYGFHRVLSDYYLWQRNGCSPASQMKRGGYAPPPLKPAKTQRSLPFT